MVGSEVAEEEKRGNVAVILCRHAFELASVCSVNTLKVETESLLVAVERRDMKSYIPGGMLHGDIVRIAVLAAGNSRKTRKTFSTQRSQD